MYVLFSSTPFTYTIHRNDCSYFETTILQKSGTCKLNIIAIQGDFLYFVAKYGYSPSIILSWNYCEILKGFCSVEKNIPAGKSGPLIALCFSPHITTAQYRHCSDDYIYVVRCLYGKKHFIIEKKMEKIYQNALGI